MYQLQQTSGLTFPSFRWRSPLLSPRLSHQHVQHLHVVSWCGSQGVKVDGCGVKVDGCGVKVDGYGYLCTKSSESVEILPEKLTYPLKINGWKMKFPFEMVPFQGTFVHFRGVCEKLGWLHKRCFFSRQLLSESLLITWVSTRSFGTWLIVPCSRCYCMYYLNFEVGRFHQTITSKNKNPSNKRIGCNWNLKMAQVHPQKLTWNLKMDPRKRRYLLETIIFVFHVSFRGCNQTWKSCVVFFSDSIPSILEGCILECFSKDDFTEFVLMCWWVVVSIM